MFGDYLMHIMILAVWFIARIEGAEINKSLLALKECIRALDNDQIDLRLPEVWLLNSSKSGA